MFNHCWVKKLSTANIFRNVSIPNETSPDFRMDESAMSVPPSHMELVTSDLEDAPTSSGPQPVALAHGWG